MANYYLEGDSIECKAARINAKKIQIKGVFLLPQLGQQTRIQVVIYKCYRDGDAEITKELNPKEAIIKKTSNLNLGDILSANQFMCFHEGKRGLTLDVVQYSGTHKTNQICTTSFTHAEIVKKFIHIGAGLAGLPQKPKELPSKPQK